MDFAEVVRFHGHTCPGLAMGFRAATCAVAAFASLRAGDEELVAIAENTSCAVDAIQMVTGCTVGKGNLIFRDYGKQVYTFIRRADGQAIRLAVRWTPPPEPPEAAAAWECYRAGDRSPEVMHQVSLRKQDKATAILQAKEEELFTISRPTLPLPCAAQVFPTLTCAACGERVMAPKTAYRGDLGPLCIPCQDGA